MQTEGKDGEAIYLLRIAPDAYRTPFESTVRGWFYFSVAGAAADETLRFVIAPYGNQSPMVSAGWRPVVSSRPSKPGWQYLRQPCFMAQQAHPDKPDGPPCWALHFRHTVSACAPGETLYFAFSFPYDLATIHSRLDAVCQAWGDACASGGLKSPAADQDRRVPPLYVARTVLAVSLEGRPLPLLVLSNTRGVDWTGARMPGTALGQGCFPFAPVEGEGERLGHGKQDEDAPRPVTIPQPHSFLPTARKRSLLLSARVHPGETPGSFLLDGALDVLTRQPGLDPRADALRDAYVIYILPVLNPDGVERGHYRLDTRGVNLNRAYGDPTRQHAPGIHAVKVSCHSPLWSYDMPCLRACCQRSAISL